MENGDGLLMRVLFYAKQLERREIMEFAPKMFEPTDETYPWKTWKSSPKVKPDDKITINLRSTYGLKIIKPEGCGTLGTTS